jgi:hypothetical protein
MTKTELIKVQDRADATFSLLAARSICETAAGII